MGRSGEGYLAGVRTGLPFALVVGVVASPSGFSPAPRLGVIAPIVFSVTTSPYGQFAVAMVRARVGALTAIAAAVLLNARFLTHRRVRSPFLRGGPFRRAWRPDDRHDLRALRSGTEGASTGPS